ncbi:MAG: hypothetical protein JW741_03100 [Sedimentisphaerales bacterium]|nr:hypothetical protein [Sedimentisphaerales bacterium]
MSDKTRDRDLIRQFEEIARFELGAEAVERDLKHVRESLSADGWAVFSARRKPWQRLAASRWAQGLSAVAACLVVALGVHWFSDTEVNAAVLLSKVAANLNKARWVKNVTRSYLPGQTEPASVDEQWMDLEGRKVYSIYNETYIHLMDYAQMHWSVYNPESREMVIQKLSGEWAGPGTQLSEYVKKLREEGLQVTQSQEVRNGVAMTVIAFDEVLTSMNPDPNQFRSKMSISGKSVKTIRTRFVVDPATCQLGEGQISYFDAADALIVTRKMECRPLETGPADIYELGVPRDVTIINKLPDPRVEEIRNQIEQHRGNFLRRYVAVQTEAEIEDGHERIMEAMVIYRKDKKLRVDVFRNFYGTPDELTGPWADVLATSMEHMEPFWSDKGRFGVRSIRIYDGLWQHILDEHENQMILRTPQRRPGGDAYSDDDVDDFGWRMLWWLGEPEHMYEDDFSRDNALLAMELTGQGYHHIPKRLVLYVDPEKDYLYRRYSEEELLEAPWQEGEGGADAVKSDDGLREQVRVYDVVEYGQTSSGQWYPKVVTIKGYNQTAGRPETRKSVDRVSRIHLIEENPNLPAALFDTSQLKR